MNPISLLSQMYCWDSMKETEMKLNSWAVGRGENGGLPRPPEA